MILEATLLIILILFLGFIYLSSRYFFKFKKLSGFFFTTLILSSIVWTLSLYYFRVTESNFIIDIAAKFIWVAAPFLVSNLYAYTKAFKAEDLNQERLINKNIIFINIMLALGLSLVSLATNTVVVDVDIVQRKIFYGPAYYLVIVYIFANALLILKNVFSHRKQASTNSKKAVNIISLGIILTLLSTLFTNIIVPLSIGNSQYSFLGIYTTIPTNFAIAYGIFSYRLFETRILIGRIIYLTLMSIILVIGFYVSYFIDQVIWGDSATIGGILTGLPIGIIFITIYDWVRKGLQKNINSKIINPGYDPNEEIANFNIQISSQLDAEDIAMSLKNILIKNLRPSFALIIVKTKKTKTGSNIIHTAVDSQLMQANFENVENLWNQIGYREINFEEFSIEIPTDLKPYTSLINNVLRELDSTSIKLILPILDPRDLVGILVIGHKDSDAPYNRIQIEFIKNLTNIAGIALGRSKLYEQVQEFNSKLQKEVKLATSELQIKNQALEEQLRKEKDMMDILGHELRTPLSIARNAVLMMKTAIDKLDVDSSKSELTNLFTKASENIRREVKILETVLSSTRIENNRLQISYDKVSLKDVIEDSLEGNKAEAEKKKLNLHTELPAEDIYITGGREQVQEIVDNLVSNAVKYTQKGEVKITINKEGRYGTLSITDTGEGIPESAIPNLGKKFYRVNPYLHDSDAKLNIIRPGGTGIGLYVVFNLVKMMQGEIDIQSKVGEGSTFTIKLPIYDVIEKELPQIYPTNTQQISTTNPTQENTQPKEEITLQNIKLQTNLENAKSDNLIPEIPA